MSSDCFTENQTRASHFAVDVNQSVLTKDYFVLQRSQNVC